MAGTTEKVFKQLTVNYVRWFFFLRHWARGHRADDAMTGNSLLPSYLQLKIVNLFLICKILSEATTTG
jgi:hypothetical protein